MVEQVVREYAAIESDALSAFDAFIPAVLGTDAAIPMLHEKVVQGNAAGVTGAAFDPREQAPGSC